MARYYCTRESDNSHQLCDILLDHGLKSPDFRTYVIRKEDLNGWKICEALNQAYKAGREDAMKDLRNFIGINNA